MDLELDHGKAWHHVTSNTPTPTLPSDVEELSEIGKTSRGYTIFVKEGEQGPEYWSDEIGGGVCVWHTALSSPESVKMALDHYTNASIPTDKEAVEIWRHKKRGTTYKRIGRAHLQTQINLPDDAQVEVYQSEADGALWVRPSGEFFDGRFEKIVEAAPRARSASVTDAETELRNFRARVFTCRQVDGCDHNTACTIWGDDGFGGTKEGFKEPLPCNCGALTNYAKRPAPPAHGEGELVEAIDAAFNRRIGQRSGEHTPSILVRTQRRELAEIAAKAVDALSPSPPQQDGAQFKDVPDPSSHQTGWEADKIDGLWRVGMRGNLDTVHDAVVTVHQHRADDQESRRVAEWIAGVYNAALGK